jgi:hypothetical protein
MKIEDEKKIGTFFLKHICFWRFPIEGLLRFELLGIFFGCFHYEAILGFALWVT